MITFAGLLLLAQHILDEETESVEKDNFLRMSRSRGSCVSVDAETGVIEKHHVFFLKVHKAASTSVQNVMLRFALSRDLQVMLPKQGHILSQSSKKWSHRALPPAEGTSRFDILCNHLVFEERTVRASLHPDAIFIGIVRHPFHQFVSAFMYYRYFYRQQYLLNVTGSDPLSTYLANPAQWEPADPGLSYTNNRISFDFGIDPKGMHNSSYVASYVEYLNRTFHLVLVSERFDESMVLMKRLLGWNMKDILYVHKNVYSSAKDSLTASNGRVTHTDRKTKDNYTEVEQEDKYTEEQKLAHRRYNMADYVLYEHFSRLFDKRVSNQGRLFADEVTTFRTVRENVENFCFNQNSHGKTWELYVNATPWNDPFFVSRKDCTFMTMSEEQFVRTVKP